MVENDIKNVQNSKKKTVNRTKLVIVIYGKKLWKNLFM